MAVLNSAVLLALSSALCVAIGDVLQQHAAHRITDRSVGHLGLVVRLLRNRRWRWGSVALIASIGLQAAALNRGSVLLVQPLLTLSLLFALPIYARMSNRTVAAREWIWAGLLTAAVSVIVNVGDPQAGLSKASLQTWAAVAAVVGPLVLGCVVAAQVRGGALAAVLFALASGLLWGVYTVLTKEVVHTLDAGLWAVARTPQLYAWLLVMLGGIVWGQAAFRAGPLTASMPTLQVSQPIVAAALGVFVLDERLNTSLGGMIPSAAAALVMVVAIFQLARVDAVATGERADREDRGRAPVAPGALVCSRRQPDSDGPSVPGGGPAQRPPT